MINAVVIATIRTRNPPMMLTITAIWRDGVVLLAALRPNLVRVRVRQPLAGIGKTPEHDGAAVTAARWRWIATTKSAPGGENHGGNARRCGRSSVRLPAMREVATSSGRLSNASADVPKATAASRMPQRHRWLQQSGQLSVRASMGQRNAREALRVSSEIGALSADGVQLIQRCVDHQSGGE